MKPAVKQFGKDVLTMWKWLLWGLRWLAVVVFTVLLIVGFIFKLPWKVLVCLAIVPIVGIFVPKKMRAWAWAGMMAVIVSVFVWIRLPDNNTAEWNVYQYKAELEKLQNERCLDPQSNAALRYETLMDSYGESIFTYPQLSERTEYGLYNSPWNYEDFPMIAQWLAAYQSGIEELLQITQISECRFSIPKTLLETRNQMERLNRMKGWARLTLWSANQDLARARLQKAREKYEAVLQMANHLYQQQTLFDQSAAFDIELLAFRAISQYIIDYCENPEMLDFLPRAFEELDTGWAKSWTSILDREKLILKNIMGLLYETNEEGDVRIAHSAMYALQEGLGYRPRKLFLNQHEMDRLAVIGLWLSLPRSPQSLAELIDKHFDYYSLLAQKGDTLPSVPVQYSWRMGLNIKSLIDWFAIERVRYFWALHGQNKRHRAMVDLMRIFSALKKYRLQHNEWPDHLEVLQVDKIPAIPLDPVYGKPFVYHKVDDGFHLYSLGPNGVDDNGIKNSRQNKDDIVFWPRPASPHEFDDGLVSEKTIHKP